MTDSADSPTPPADLIRAALAAAVAEADKPKSDGAKAETPKPEPLKAERRAPATPVAAPKPPHPAKGGWADKLTRPLASSAWRWPAAAAGMVVAAGLGYGAAHLGASDDKADIADQRWHEATASLQQTHGEVARLAAELKSVRGALDGLKGDRSRGDLGAKQAQLSDKLDRMNADSTAKITRLAEQLDRIEKTQRDPSRLTPVVERLDRIEKQTMTVADKVTAPTPPPKPVAAAVPLAEPAHTGSLGEVKPAAKQPEFDPRKTQLDTHILRDVDEGVALVEARNGRVFTVHAGQVVAGLGKIEAVERRGRQWVVVTAKGYIGERLP